MLCPECKQSCPGGTFCPQCHNQVPERESFRGQGGHYLRVLSSFSLLMLVALLIANGGVVGLRQFLEQMSRTGGIWLLLVIFLLPIGVGIYYWFLLREEEVIVTDEYIARRSHWGNEHVAWRDVIAFRKHPVLFKQTRLGRVAWLSRLFRKSQVFLKIPKVSYEIVTASAEGGGTGSMRLEPGTIEDMDWLLQLVSEHIGPPKPA